MEEENSPRPTPGIRLSHLPSNLRASARALVVSEFDRDGDGVIDEGELAMAIEALQQSRKQNKNLTKISCGLVGAVALLIGAVFGSSVAAARLSKDTQVDSRGFLKDKKGMVLATREALKWDKDRNLVEMTNHELAELQRLTMKDGNLHFNVRGFARSEDNQVILMVDSGTLTFGEEGMMSATGDALSLVEAAFGEVDSESNRKLWNRYAWVDLIGNHHGGGGIDVGFGTIGDYW